ncbi:MAG TPA: hypothetical protein PLU11_08660 [Chitinophagaceae bacterium]|nr:hypothetical protein [Chitinophagaceae bacterium]HPH32959.1 hypothetical protein [Chitinophagaceae bacterium]HPN59231.1 hypothetical protein [Chitinophagaceae bacterium]
MRWLLFLSRLAFICGIAFLVSLGIAMAKTENNEPISSTIIMIGYGMGMVLVPFTVLCYLLVAFSKKKLRQIVPLWLIIANIIFLCVLVYYIFYLNDPYYHQG